MRRSSVLLIVPAEDRPLSIRQLRVGYIEKRPLRAQLGVGPLLLTATLHFGPREPASFEGFVYNVGARFFIPVTEATMTSQYGSWVLKAPLVLVNRAAVHYGCLLERADDPQVDEPSGSSSQDVWFGQAARHGRMATPRNRRTDAP